MQALGQPFSCGAINEIDVPIVALLLLLPHASYQYLPAPLQAASISVSTILNLYSIPVHTCIAIRRFGRISPFLHVHLHKGATEVDVDVWNLVGLVEQNLRQIPTADARSRESTWDPFLFHVVANSPGQLDG